MSSVNEHSDSGRVLLIEDDNEIADVVAMNLRDLSLQTERAVDGRTGLRLAREAGYALIILDLMLPELDGVSVCRSIRENDRLTPIIMLTAKSDEIDRVVGLEVGADDYITKPFSVRELVARVKALLRRAEAGRHATSEPASERSTEPTAGTDRATAGDDEKIEIENLILDTGKRKVTLEGRAIDLTAKEFDLLRLFMKNPGRAFSRTDLLNLVWGYQFEGYEHTVNTHINRLRNKIEKHPGHPRYLKTLWGVGYRFAEIEELEQ